MTRTIALLAVCGLATTAFAQARTPSFSEILINPPGADNGNEFFEIRGEPGASLAGLWIVTIDGDNNTTGTSIATGKIDFAFDLSQYSLGTNGLLLLRDSATVLNPAPAAGTTIIAGPDFVGCSGTTSLPPAVNIDIENGASSYLIVRGFTGSACQDLDTDNNGILDVTPWAAVVDSVGFVNAEDARNPDLQNLVFVYAVQLGGIDVSDRRVEVANGFTPDFVARVCGPTTFVADALGTAGGPYGVDVGEVLFFPSSSTVQLPDPYFLTPGTENPCPASTPRCGSIDFNGDGLFPDDSDLIEFLSVLAGGTCSTGTCGSIDFNADGLFPDDNDLIDFLTVLAGGTPTSCTP